LSTVNIHTGHDTRLQLTDALLMYRSGDGAVYATTHPIQMETDNPARKIIGAGVPLTKTALAEFAKLVGAATSFDGFVPDNLLYTGPNMIAWWTPASIRKCWFRSPNKFIGTQLAEVAHPALVFVAVPGDWFVFALAESARPGPDTKLQHAPHFNVWNGGRICTGNVDLPGTADSSAIGAYERAFFNSNFTHPNRTDATNHRGGMTSLWRAQIKRPNPEQMRRALKPAGETLRKAIERINNRTSKSL
jgi:PRTRC genetic system protein B